MPAIVRVKRRIDEEPLSAFVLNGKKRRLDAGTSSSSNNKDEVSTVLKFAGTLTAQDNDATTNYARLRKSEAKDLIKQKVRKSTTTTIERQRQEQREASHENRFRVVNCLRTTLHAGADDDDGETASGGAPKAVTIVDIEKTAAAAATEVAAPSTSYSSTQTANATTTRLSNAGDGVGDFAEQQQPVDSDSGYVYDLYLPENEQQAAEVDLMDDYHLRVRAINEVYLDDCYDNDESSNESDDSNDENYRGNDYPEEEEGSCGDRSDDDNDELCKAVKDFVMDDDDDYGDGENGDHKFSSSDDDYDDSFVHHVDGSTDDFVDDVDKYTADRYGTAYARYKARILKAEKKDKDDDDSSSDNIDYYD